ncbi:mechanosensitive ion channel domain-containing protein [uncultured Gilvimarinus sp.]|mgnify:CR=1 FL=1|uniref:mechanosensitive ion channel domain-containing protein n=1 Tax=uncultured Gilvimarinus sp. TaxID=1689143 RepID=UPI0030EED7BC|tara:strand:+ start:7683 stop:9263 length:1581 start_codon:yes stop_codon:yes gene_type:complete
MTFACRTLWRPVFALLMMFIVASPISAMPGLGLDIGSDSSSSQQGSENSSSAACEGQECDAGSEGSRSQAVDVDHVINVDEVTQSWESGVEGLLDRLGFESSASDRWVAIGLIVLVAIVVFFFVLWAVKKLFRKLHAARKRFRFNHKRLSFYHRLINILAFLFIFIFAGLAVMAVGGDGSTKLTISQTVASWFESLFSFLIALIFAVILFEVISAALEHYFYRLEKRGSSRINTLVPIARNVLYGVVLVIFGITVIAELGIDVTPLLAGAGVVGVAIGFGAQALIKDVLNGFIIIVEDLIQVGDVAAVGGKTGLVEKITLRKVQLRDLDGRVYTVPFSEITVVENYTKHFSYYMFNVGIAYRESPDEVIDVLKSISAELEKDDDFKELILEPLEVLGVDAFADSAIVIKARIKTLPIQQWKVGREFNRRMKYAFDEHNIEIPFPHQTLYFGEDKDGSAPPARLMVERITDADDALQANADNDEPSGDAADSGSGKKHDRSPTAKRGAQQPSSDDDPAEEADGGEGR